MICGKTSICFLNYDSQFHLSSFSFSQLPVYLIYSSIIDRKSQSRRLLTNPVIQNTMVSVKDMRKYDIALFDLDGTLSASAEGVRLSIAYTMDALSLPCPDLSDYTLYIGPPLEDTFRGMCAVPEELIPAAMQTYRDRYDEVGILHNGLYDGVCETLAALRKAGCRLAVCTSKNEPVAEKVIASLGLSGAVDAVCGSSLDGSRKAKADLIPYAMDALGSGDRTRTVMIGDTHFDAEGARLCGVDFIGVTYGYGTRESMEACGAVGFADTAGEIADFIIMH